MACVHLNTLITQSGTDAYRTIHSSLVSPNSLQGLERKAKSALCLMCHSHGPRLHACLHCIFIGCVKDQDSNSHRDVHARQKSHPCLVELTYGNVYCFECGDYVYHTDLEAISDATFDKAAKSLSLCGRGGVRYTPWKPSQQEVGLLKIHRKRKGFSQNSTVGLRGLINLGNTCFMSCIVQTLIHTPLLRDYFLSDRHVCFFQGERDQCIVCEVSRLFQEFYSGAKSPLVPHVLLHMTWQQAHHLAGYEQQDAHEFLIATLNLLHAHLTRRGPGDDARSSTNCDCIVDTIFKGRLQSDVVCQACQNVSTTIEPFYDISLDLPTVVPVGQTGPISIQDCLERFTKPEYLGSAAKIKCSTCLSYQESTKQLTMRQLPIVASFHLKRFEHSSRLHKKISTRVAYPEVLDLSPFVSHKRNNANQPDDGLPLRDNKYTLFAVINHIGNIEAGHYTSFIRQHRDKWFRCNDHQIYPTTIAEVLDSEGYLLFYHKQFLEYH